MHIRYNISRTEKYPDGIFLSSALVQELGLEEESITVLVGDEDDPRQWFLCIVDDEGGFPVRLKKRKR